MGTDRLPPELEGRLTGLATRVRRLRIVCGACRLAVAVLLSIVALSVFDSVLQLSVLSRCLLQLAWLAATGLLTWQLVIRPWTAEVPLEEAARLIEGHFPGLGERLLTIVSLRNAEPENGSPYLIANLARDTELRTREMNFARAVPLRPAVRLTAVAGITVLAAVATAAAVPGSLQQLRRVGMPWYRPTPVAPFHIFVTSADPVVRRGGPVTLSAYLEPIGQAAALPDSAVLVIRDGPDAPERKLPMTGDGTAAFHVTRPSVTEDFQYRVEVAPATSDWHTVQAADPVELTDQTAVEVVPPAYARNVAARSTPGFGDLDGLQFSTAAIRLRFNRPAASAVLDWRAEGRGAADAEFIPFTLTPDATGGAATFTLRSNGVLRLVLINEDGPRKLRTETAVLVHAAVDAPPQFEQVSGVTTQPRTVRPAERVPVSLVATDDIGVGSAELEYALNGDSGKTARIPIPLDGAGTTRAEGRAVLDLMGKGAEGDAVRYRVRVTDNRRLGDPKLGPQEAVYPPGGWAELRLSESAPPLDQQEAFGQRDAIRDALLAALAEVKRAHSETATLRADSAGRSPLPVDHMGRLNAVREYARKATVILHDAARDAVLTPELRPFAAMVRDVADRPLRDADDFLRKATTDNPDDRGAALGSALARLAEVEGRIEDLLKHNGHLAQSRLDRRRLEALAADQSSLANRLKTDPRAPSNNPLQAQRELIDRLGKLFAESEALRNGAARAAGREARRLAKEANDLAGTLRELDAAATRLAADLRRSLLQGLAASQAAFADRAGEFYPRIDTASRLARATLPSSDELRKVVDLLTQDRPVEAQVELEKHAQALDRAAAEFDRWVVDRKDPKRAAQQLATWQDDLRARIAAVTKEIPFARLPAPAREAIRVEQRAILRAAERLRVPSDAEVATLRGAAFIHLKMALKRVEGDGTGADQAMALAVEALNKLVKKIPTAAERLRRTRPELDRIRFEQESIVTAAEQALRPSEKSLPDAQLQQALSKRLTAVQERQQKLAEQLAALDLPGLEARQSRAVGAAQAAAADLKAGVIYDIAASLSRARRELDRVRQEADGVTPADDQAEELVRLQQGVVDSMALLGPQPTPKQLEPLAATQQNVGRQLATLVAPEAAALLHDAREAVQLAEVGFRDGLKPEEIGKRVRAAADALTRLADRLNNREADLDRVKRLADCRRRTAASPPNATGKSASPDPSGEGRRQLGREAEELTHTRVGAAGQVAKKKALDLYARLQLKDAPDRDPAGQKQLAQLLDELAKAMAGVAELAAAPGRNSTPVEADPADAYLPSRSMADSLREMARQQRAFRERVNGLAAEAATRSRPGKANPLAALEQRQRELAQAVATCARSLAGEKEPGVPEGAGKAADAARLAADRLQLGLARPARQSGELAIQQLKAVAASGGGRPWGKTAAALAEKQAAILNELDSVLNDPAAATAQQKARQDQLAKRAFELAHTLELAARNAPADSAAVKPLMTAAELAGKAERLLADAAKPLDAGTPADANPLRAEAEKLLQQAGDAAGATAPPTELGPATADAGGAAKEAERAMQQAADELRQKGDPAAAERAMRQAADALNRAAKSTGNSPSAPPPDGRPSPGKKSNGNTGAGLAPVTAGDLTPERIERLTKAWGELPGNVKAQFIQDLQARYGEDYAQAIKLYFEQLAERP